MNFRHIVAGIFAVMLVASPMAAAASSPGLNYSDDRAPNPYFVEDTLTIASHGRAEMDSVLDYEDDNGDIQTLPATHNTSQTHQYSISIPVG